MKKYIQPTTFFSILFFFTSIVSAQLVSSGNCQQMTPYMIGGISDCVINVTTKDQQGASPSGFTYTWKVNGNTIITNGSSNDFNYPVDENGSYIVTVILTIPDSTPLCTATASTTYIASNCEDNNTPPPPPTPTCPSNGITLNNVECMSTGGGDASANWQVNKDHVEKIIWRYSLGGANQNVFISETFGNPNNGMHQVNWNLPTTGLPPSGSWDGYNLIVKARAYLVNGIVCAEFTKTLELDCPGGVIGTGSRTTSVFPNPSKTGLISLTSSASKMEISNISVLNMFGNIIETINNGRTNFDISNQKNGIYFIKIDFKDGTTETHKVVLDK